MGRLDKIQRMDEEEFADLLLKLMTKPEYCRLDYCQNRSCKDCVVEWLREAVADA